jgi:hypothetical protein
VTDMQIARAHSSDARVLKSRAWLAWTGVGAGIAGALACMLSAPNITAEDRRSDPVAAVVDAFDGAEVTLKIAAALGLVAAALVVLFATHLRRRLEQNAVLADVAWAGGLITAGSVAIASLFTATAGTLTSDSYRDTTLEMYAATVSNLPFAAWMPLGLTMAALAVAFVRGSHVPAWLSAVSAIGLAALVAVLALGLPFASWVIAAIWLVVAGVGTSRNVGT